MTNEEILDNLRETTSEVLSALNRDVVSNSELLEAKVISICNQFIELDISLSYNNGDLPGAWGSSKLSKSNQ
jgi:hypothetical protein